MIKFFMIPVLILFSFFGAAQNKLKSIGELVSPSESGWTIVQEWIKDGKNKVVVLPVDSMRAKEALYKVQVTTRSPMGAIVYYSGGLLIDDGWIRILGSGSATLNRSLPDWNKGKSFKEFGESPSFLLIADDAIGGFFLLNGGGLGKDLGKVYYFAPSSLKFEPLDITYSEFLQFCFNNNLDEFYKGYRWKKWRDEVIKLDGDKVFNFFPYLWSKEGKDINKVTRNIIPVQEQFEFNIESRKKLGLDK